MKISKFGICSLWFLVSLVQFGCKPAPVKTNLRMGFYNNADGSPVVPLIKNAQKTLDMEVYEMDDPAVIAAIRDALNRGVDVRIVKEPKPVGGSCDVFANSQGAQSSSGDDSPGPGDRAASCADQQALVNDVNDSGGSYIPFNKQTLCPGGKSQCFEHGKLVLVDASVALVSSGNFNTTNLCDLDASPSVCNRDYSMLTDDASVVNALENIVEKDLAGQAYDMGPMLGLKLEDKLTVSPLSLQPLVSFIHSAQKSIQIENQYLNEPNLNAALVEAAKRGVQISVTVASACAFGTPSPYDANRTTAIYTAFDQAGISSRMFSKLNLVDGMPGYLHAKAIIVDATRAWVGSVNGSTSAVSYNREFGLFFDKADDVAKLSSIMALDHSASEGWQAALACAENH